MSKAVMSRRGLLAGAAAVIAGLGLHSALTALAEGGASGGSAYTSPNSIFTDTYWFAYWFDEGGFEADVNGKKKFNPTQGWEGQSIQYFWDHYVKPTCDRGTGQPMRSDHGSASWGYRNPDEVFWDVANEALTKARNRGGGHKARVVGVAGGYMSTKYNFWQFLDPNQFSWMHDWHFRGYFPRVPNSSELKGKHWDSDSSYAGGRPGEPWRDFIYRRAYGDLGDTQYGIIVIAVNDLEAVEALGKVEIVKKSANEQITNGNSNYSLAGTKFEIRQGSKVVDVVTIGEDGKGTSKDIEAGDYDVVEATPGKGFIEDGTTWKVTVKSGETVRLNA